jgi:hypothetical protein
MQASVHVVVMRLLLFQQHCDCVEAARMLQHSQAAKAVQVSYSVYTLTLLAVVHHFIRTVLCDNYQCFQYIDSCNAVC